MDYLWLVEAAGTDKQRLAQLSVLLAGAAITDAQMMTAETRAHTTERILSMRAAIHEIGLRMGMEKEMAQIVKDVWDTTGKD